jgi:hypothetical protein
MITETILPNLVGDEARDVMLVRQIALQNIKHNLKLAQEQMKKHADKKRTERVLQVGTWTTSSYNHTCTMPWEFTRV